MKACLYILFVFLLALACKPDPRIPKWDIDALAPIAHSRLQINKLVADSSLKVAPDGLLSLVYQKRLAHLQPSEIIDALNANFENTIKLQNIDLGTRKVEDAISLGDLAKGGSPSGQFIIYNNGNMAAIPPIPAVTNKRFNVDATKYFQTITLSSGDVTLQLHNGLPVPLTNIDFVLRNKTSGTNIIQKSLSTLNPGQTYTEQFSLANLTIEGNLQAVLQNFDSPGSNGNIVQIDTSNKILISLTLENLKPTSATAIFPAQNLANDTTDTEIKAGRVQLKGIKVKSGSIFLDATSTIEDEISLDYSIPNAKKNGTALSFNEKIPAAPMAGSSNKFKQIDISGYNVDLTGRPNNLGVYNSFYTVLIGRIDSSGNLINLSLNDSVYLKTGITNLTADQGYGYLGKDTINSIQSSKVDLFKGAKGGNFDLDNALLSISIENNIGAPIGLRLNQLRAIQSSGSVALNWTKLGQDQQVPPASLVGGKPSPGLLTLQMDKSNSNIDKLFENKPENLESDISAFLNNQSSTPAFNQFIFADYGLDAFLNLEIPMNFSAASLLLLDSTHFDYHDLDPDNQLQKGTLKLIADNNFPLQCSVEIILLNDKDMEIGMLTSTDHIEAAAMDNNGASTNTVRSIVNYPLAKEDVKILQQTTRLVFRVLLDTPLNPQKVKLYNKNFIDLTLSGDVTIRTK